MERKKVLVLKGKSSFRDKPKSFRKIDQKDLKRWREEKSFGL